MPLFPVILPWKEAAPASGWANLSWLGTSWVVLGQPHADIIVGVRQVMMDFHACHWPSHLGNGTGTELAQYFDEMNEPGLSQVEAAITRASDSGDARPPVTSFSHYLPIQVVNSPQALLRNSRHP